MINNESMLMPNRWQTYIGVMTESTTFKNQRWFGVYVPEFLPTHAGDVQPDYVEQDATVKNVWSGKPVAEEGKMRNLLTAVDDCGKVKVTKTIRADYWGWNPSEDVPTMYRGMQVLLINFANLDRWYWIPLERDRSYKTFEHIRFSANNIALTNKNAYQDAKDEDKTEIYKRNTALFKDDRIENENKETTYYLEIDTKYHKHVKIHTSHSDGEEFDYTFEIDTEKQFVEIHDKCVDGSQLNNTIILESRPDKDTKGRIKLQTAARTTFLLNGEDMEISVPRNLKIDVGGDFFKRVNGNELNSTRKDSHDLVFGNYKRQVKGETAFKYEGNVVEGVTKNKSVGIMGQHQEKQASRQTISGVASWESEGSWSLGTGSTKIKTDSMALDAKIGAFNIDHFTMHAKKALYVIGSFSMQIVSSMICYVPYHAYIPMIPVISHTLIF